MLIVVRGRKIRVNAKSGTQRAAYERMYSQYSDERLDELEAERVRDNEKLDH